MVSNDSIVSIGFHAKALSSNPSRNVAQSLHYPHRREYKNSVTLLTSLVYNLADVGRGIQLCNEVQEGCGGDRAG